jgi:hypothetical protein
MYDVKVWEINSFVGSMKLTGNCITLLLDILAVSMSLLNLREALL